MVVNGNLVSPIMMPPAKRPKGMSALLSKELEKIQKLEEAEKDAKGAMDPEQLATIAPLRGGATGIWFGHFGDTRSLFVARLQGGKKRKGGSFGAWWKGECISSQPTATQAALVVANHLQGAGIVGRRQLATSRGGGRMPRGVDGKGREPLV